MTTKDITNEGWIFNTAATENVDRYVAGKSELLYNKATEGIKISVIDPVRGMVIKAEVQIKTVKELKVLMEQIRNYAE